MGVLRGTVAGQASGAGGARWRPAVAGLSLMAAAGLAVGGCGSSSTGSSSAPGCFTKAAASAQAGTVGGPASPAAHGSAAAAGGPASPVALGKDRLIAPLSDGTVMLLSTWKLISKD